MSPGRVTATAAGSTISFSAASRASVEASRASPMMMSASPIEKPVRSMSYLASIRPCSSIASSSLSQPAFERELVVGEDVGAFFGLRQVREAQAGHRRHADRSGGKHAAVAGDDAVAVIDQHRVGEPVPLDRFRDLLDLFFRVRPCVARIGLQVRDSDILDAIVMDQGHSSVLLGLGGWRNLG